MSVCIWCILRLVLNIYPIRFYVIHISSTCPGTLNILALKSWHVNHTCVNSSSAFTCSHLTRIESSHEKSHKTCKLLRSAVNSTEELHDVTLSQIPDDLQQFTKHEELGANIIWIANVDPCDKVGPKIDYTGEHARLLT